MTFQATATSSASTSERQRLAMRPQPGQRQVEPMPHGRSARSGRRQSGQRSIAGSVLHRRDRHRWTSRRSVRPITPGPTSRSHARTYSACRLQLARQDDLDVVALGVGGCAASSSASSTNSSDAGSVMPGPHRQHPLAQRRRVQRHVARHLGSRADQAHVAAQHVDQLRQLVDAVWRSQRPARVIRGRRRPSRPGRAPRHRRASCGTCGCETAARRGRRAPGGRTPAPANRTCTHAMAQQQQRRQQRPAPSDATHEVEQRA